MLVTCLFTFFKDSPQQSRLLSSSKWCTPLYIIALLRSLMDSMNSTLKSGIEGRVLISGGGGKVGGKVNKWRGGSNKWGMINRYEEAFFFQKYA